MERCLLALKEMDFEARFDDAERLEHQGDLQGALELRRKLAASDPCVATYCALAQSAHQLDHRDEAHRALNSAAALEPGNPHNGLCRVNLAELFCAPARRKTER